MLYSLLYNLDMLIPVMPGVIKRTSDRVISPAQSRMPGFTTWPESALNYMTKQRNFRPWPENQTILESADRAGFNVSELLNEVIAKHLQRHLQSKARKAARIGGVK